MAANTRCFTTDSRFVISGRLLTFRLRNEAESGPLALRLACSPHKFPPDGLLHPTLASATCRTGNLHGELLSVHKISQAYPGAPETRRKTRRGRENREFPLPRVRARRERRHAVSMRDSYN